MWEDFRRHRQGIRIKSMQDTCLKSWTAKSKIQLLPGKKNAKPVLEILNICDLWGRARTEMLLFNSQNCSWSCCLWCWRRSRRRNRPARTEMTTNHDKRNSSLWLSKTSVWRRWCHFGVGRPDLRAFWIRQIENQNILTAVQESGKAETTQTFWNTWICNTQTMWNPTYKAQTLDAIGLVSERAPGCSPAFARVQYLFQLG